MLGLPIISKENPLIKQIVKLAKDSNYRYELGLAVVYGEHLIAEANNTGILDTVILSHNCQHSLLREIQTNKIFTVPSLLFKKINLLNVPESIIGLIKIRANQTNVLPYNEDCIVLDCIQDPGNLGTIMRVATTAGIKNIVLSGLCVDVYNTKVLRAYQGLQFGLNIFSGIDLNSFIHYYSGNVIAATPHAVTDIYALDLLDPTAWVFGNEGSGINQDLLAMIDTKAKIPLLHGESLNVAIASAVCVFEMMRQRLNK
jgi:TrmH family RNA methyltransferase